MTTSQQILKHRDAFKGWLSAHGASVGVPTNEWELVRFVGKGILSVVYRNKLEVITFTAMAERCWAAFKRGEDINLASEPRVKRRQAAPLVRALRERDGDECFFCLDPVSDKDASVEHIVAVAHSGPNHMSNLALAHKVCNNKAGHLDAQAKIKVREQAVIMRERKMLLGIGDEE